MQTNTDNKRSFTFTVIKDIAFILIGLALVTKGGFFSFIIGILALGYYGYELYVNVKLKQLQRQSGGGSSSSAGPKGPASSSSQDGGEGKITITEHLSEAKEVDYEKESCEI